MRTSADHPEGFHERTDVCVIGSGAGGGVAAGLLAEAGREVLVLEEGEHVPKERMNQREEQMYPLLYRDGGNQFTDDGGVSVLQGRCVGGSTVVNMADVVPVPAGVLAHWRAHFGRTRYSDERWEEVGVAAMAAIGTNRIQASQLNRNATLLLEGGRSLGLDGDAFLHNRVGCIGSGYCMVGCSYDSKQSVALTWIPRALATGRAQVQTEARVERLDRDGRRVTTVHGYLRNGAPFTVEADHVILAAGAVHSPLILAKSFVGGRQVGRNMSLQPQSPVSAIFEDEVLHYRGVPQASFIDSTEWASEQEGLAGYRLESISSTPGMAATSTIGWGPQAEELMKSYRRTAACLCLVPDRPGGRVTRKSDGRPRIQYPFQKLWAERMGQAIRTAAEVYLAAGATLVVLPLAGAPEVRTVEDLKDLPPIRPNTIPLLSAHVQGTVRWGDVLDDRFFVNGLDNLQVLDASIFPTTASSHTMLPVMQAAMLGVSELL